MKTTSNERRQAIRRAQTALVRLAVCAEAAKRARRLNGIVKDVEVFTDPEAWDAMEALEQMVHAQGLDEIPTRRQLLEAGALYIAYDRLVCGALQCAGSSATYAGVTIGGVPLLRFGDADADAWADATETSATCECGALTYRRGSVS